MAASRNVRVWFEYVESEANGSDGPSRLGEQWMESALAASIGCTMEAAQLPSLSLLEAPPASSLEAFAVARDLVLSSR